MASHHPLIISLLSLVADQCGGVEIDVWSLAQRSVFRCGVEIGVGLWVCRGLCGFGSAWVSLGGERWCRGSYLEVGLFDIWFLQVVFIFWVLGYWEISQISRKLRFLASGFDLYWIFAGVFLCLFVFFLFFFCFFVFGVDGRLWVAGGGGVCCV